MASTWNRSNCFTCSNDTITHLCKGCSKRFCLAHLAQHQTDLIDQLYQIECDHDELRTSLNDQISNPIKASLLQKIDLWEKKSIEQIKQTAQQCRYELISYSKRILFRKEKKLNDISRQIKAMNQDDEVNEVQLNDLQLKFDKFQKEFHQSTKISIKERPTSFISTISLVISSVGKDVPWKQVGLTIAGGRGQGEGSNQFQNPFGIFFDRQYQTIYIADCFNHRIVKWKANSTDGEIVAAANGQGHGTDQLDRPTDVILDRQDKSLIIADSRNRRVVRWSREKNEYKEIIISNIDCYGLAMHEDGTLYVSDCGKNEVRQWKQGETRGTLVAGGNGKGNRRNQLDLPTYLFVDDDYTLYVSDRNNHRVMKWMKGAKEGIVVAGGNDQGDHMTQLFRPQGLAVDQLGQVYVADCWNHRVMRWSAGMKEGTIVIGGSGKGEQPNRLSCPVGLSLDVKGNLYVVDNGNNRIQKFEIEQSEKKT